MHVQVLPALSDNYIFLIAFENDRRLVIDPGEAAPVISALGQHKLNAILLTHHHTDHVRGVDELVATYGCPVHFYTTAQRVELFDESVEILYTPGHTADHISYYFPNQKMLFCGDTLFTGGCGRVFTQDYAAMFQSLQKIKQLPPETIIYSAHEYTVSNYTFAVQQAPENNVIKQRLAWAKQQRAKGLPTVPTTLAEELSSNLFLQAKTSEAFIALRKVKDTA